MSDFVDWIGAQADEPGPKFPLRQRITHGTERQSVREASLREASWERPATHNVPGGVGEADREQPQDDPLDRNPELWQYRSRTVGLLRRFLRFSLETGRLPSIMGREFFRAKVTSYTASTFEDRVIFVRDVEQSLNRLEYWDQQLIARIILQEHDHGETAHLLHCCRKTVERRLPEVLDLLSEDFLRVGLLVALPSTGK
jgi:hypothetical protein